MTSVFVALSPCDHKKCPNHLYLSRMHSSLLPEPSKTLYKLSSVQQRNLDIRRKFEFILQCYCTPGHGPLTCQNCPVFCWQEFPLIREFWQMLRLNLHSYICKFFFWAKKCCAKEKFLTFQYCVSGSFLQLWKLFILTLRKLLLFGLLLYFDSFMYRHTDMVHGQT